MYGYYWMLDQVMKAHANDKFGEMSYVAGHLVPVAEFCRTCMLQTPEWHQQRHLLDSIVCAALGHDWMEDHPESFDFAKVTEVCGDVTSSLIAECTDDQALKYEVRKQLQIDRITVMGERRFSTGCLLIKLGDWWSHMCNWGNMAKVPSAIEHAKKANNAITMRLGKRPDRESVLVTAQMILEYSRKKAIDSISNEPH